jgi:predicted O-methyltransferase YrrM
MKASGTQEELWSELSTPAIAAVLTATEHVRGKMLPYQYAALYRLATQYDGGCILDIGGFHGRSALILSAAAPKAEIISLEPYRAEEIRKNVAHCGNVEVLRTWSWKYLSYCSIAWDMVLVDGNHKRVEADLPWFHWLTEGGLILFHDYTPAEAARGQYPQVYAAVNRLAEHLGREPDVLIQDDDLIGMAGFYRRNGERLWRLLPGTG